MSKRHRDDSSAVQNAAEGSVESPASDDPTLGQHAPSSSGETAPKSEPKSEKDTLMLALQEKDQEITELKDKYLRTLADSENARRRIRQQSEDSVRVQRENLLREILPIVDNLERAVDAAKSSGNGESIVEGVELVLASMHDLLKRHGVTSLPSVGQPFDPARHEAIDHIASEVHPPNTVVEEFHRGYQIGDRVLRPARVVVAKGNGGRGRTESENDGGN